MIEVGGGGIVSTWDPFAPRCEPVVHSADVDIVNRISFREPDISQGLGFCGERERAKGFD